MQQSYPVPPPELVEQWRTEPEFAEPGLTSVVSMTQSRLRDIAAQAAQWGADMELEACCEWIPKKTPWDAEQLRACRRPKPPSLKEQALETLRSMQIDPVVINGVNIHADLMVKYDTIRRALEQLPDAL